MNSKRVKQIITHTQNGSGKYVLYFMHQSFRMEYNHSLIYAIRLANEAKLPLVVFIGIDITLPYTNRRNLTFMMEGIKELDWNLKKHRIEVIFHYHDLIKNMVPYLEKAQKVVSDVGYTTEARKINQDLYAEIIQNHPGLDLFTVESEVIVPVEIASNHLEYGAYTLRPKLIRILQDFIELETLPKVETISYLFSESKRLQFPVIEICKLNQLQDIDPSTKFHGGYSHAKKYLQFFLDNHLFEYADSNDPSRDATSKLSIYIHHGQISTLEIYLAVLDYPAPQNSKEAFIEQLIVRRELAVNYIYFEKRYLEFDAIVPSWAIQTMNIHLKDPRPYLYNLSDYLHFRTSDPYFNACMKELVFTGFMHNYMRMYWGKKIIEWSETYEQAFETLLLLNDTYALDGRDANTYAGIAWCFGRHDRAWPERKVFGKLRYMNDTGLKRKFHMDLYLEQMSIIEQSISMKND